MSSARETSSKEMQFLRLDSDGFGGASGPNKSLVITRNDQFMKLLSFVAAHLCSTKMNGDRWQAHAIKCYILIHFGCMYDIMFPIAWYQFGGAFGSSAQSSVCACVCACVDDQSAESSRRKSHCDRITRENHKFNSDFFLSFDRQHDSTSDDDDDDSGKWRWRPIDFYWFRLPSSVPFGVYWFRQNLSLNENPWKKGKT